MRKLLRAMCFAFVLWVSLGGAAISTAMVGLQSAPFVQSAYASRPGSNSAKGLEKLESRFQELAGTIYKFAVIGCGIALVWCGIRLLQGDPHTWKYAITCIAGIVIVASWEDIFKWLTATGGA